ncbi:MAG TPA: choice-of-anchor D domain-containing protein [Terriglobia bacterium]|nr:choice-of-anchor D domain-containing protein [Terriglobia bacterium]
MLCPFHLGNPRKNPGAGPSAQHAISIFLIFVALSLVRVAVSPPSPHGAASAPAVSLSPSSLTFGSEPVATASSPQVVTLKNTGSAALNIKSITFTGANAADFTENTTCGSSVAAGGNCTIVILLTPSAIGTRKASLTIADNASAASPNSVALSGAGTHNVILGWTPSTTPGVSAYNIFRGTTSEGESATPLNSTPINGTTYTDGNVTGGATYYYVVTAIAADDVTQSASSNETSATVPGP